MIAGLPYDAEVEYLQSNNYCYIDTGVSVCNAVVGTDIKFQATATTNNSWLFGSYNGSVGNSYNYLVGSYSGWCLGLPSGFYRPGIATDTDVHVAKINIDNKTQFDDVILLNNSFGKEYSGSANVNAWMFATHRPGFGGSYYLPAKVFYCKMYRDGILAGDFIPVRFTNELDVSEGAMYDRVSRKLFRNAGAGAFTIGPDVATPVMGLHVFKSPVLAS